MEKTSFRVNADVNISELFDDIAIITITGNTQEINMSITGNSILVARCITQLNKLVESNLKEKNIGRC